MGRRKTEYITLAVVTKMRRANLLQPPVSITCRMEKNLLNGVSCSMNHCLREPLEPKMSGSEAGVDWKLANDSPFLKIQSLCVSVLHSQVGAQHVFPDTVPFFLQTFSTENPPGFVVQVLLLVSPGVGCRAEDC